VTLDCGVISGLTPEITYLWVRNGMENISMERTLMVNSEGNYTCEVSNLDGVDTLTSMVFCKCLYSKRNAMKFMLKIGSYATLH